jgi:hypothetical protein
VILNTSNIDHLSKLDITLAEQSEYDHQIMQCETEKRHLYERYIDGDTSADEYRAAKITCDEELRRLKHIQTMLADKTAQLNANSETVIQAQSIAKERKLTQAMVDSMIEQIRIHPNKHVEIIWK